jgi:hypothetical protein
MIIQSSDLNYITMNECLLYFDNSAGGTITVKVKSSGQKDSQVVVKTYLRKEFLNSFIIRL